MADIFGTPGDDNLDGTSTDDIITTDTGTDTVNAGAGDDIIIGTLGGQGTLNGGAGFDTFQIFSNFINFAIFNFGISNPSNPLLDSILTDTGQYTLDGIERIEQISIAGLDNVALNGTNGADVFNLSADTVTAGQTFIYGGSGNDEVVIGQTSTSLITYRIFLGDGDDTLTINTTSESTITIHSGLGADTITGTNTDREELDYSLSSAGINIDLAAGTSVGGHAQGDVISGIRNVSGTEFADVLIGNDEANRFFSNGGDDVLNGGGGDDTLIADVGTQILTGGSGADTFQFSRATVAGEVTSEITDLETADLINFRNGSPTDFFGTPTFIGEAAFSGAEGELRYEKIDGQTLLLLDNDGDGIADETLTISNGEFDLVDRSTFSFVLALGITPPVTGAAGDDVLFGTVNNETISGLSGADTLFGDAGNDILLGDAARPLMLESAEGELFRAYQAVFDRAPDEAGFNAFLTEIRLGNTTQEEVIEEFVESAEFQTHLAISTMPILWLSFSGMYLTAKAMQAGLQPLQLR